MAGWAACATHECDRQRQQYQDPSGIGHPAQPGARGVVIAMHGMDIRQGQVPGQQIGIGACNDGETHRQRRGFFQHCVLKPVGAIGLGRGEAFGHAAGGNHLHVHLGTDHGFVGGMPVYKNRHHTSVHDADQFKQIRVAADAGGSGACGHRCCVAVVMPFPGMGHRCQCGDCYKNNSCHRTLHKGYSPI